MANAGNDWIDRAQQVSRLVNHTGCVKINTPVESFQMRIQKYLSQHSVHSRRQIEQMIIENRILINGKIAEIGQKVTIGDKITYDQNKHTVVRMKDQDDQVLIMNKPLGIICTRRDPENRRNVFDFLPSNDETKWIAVGRLDINTSGLILFTSNGDLANQLMHPRHGLVRTYHVRVFGQPTEQDMQRLLSGIHIDGKRQRFLSCQILNQKSHQANSQNQWYEISVGTGQYRLVRRMWQACDCRVSRLVRVSYGPIMLPRSLKEGQVSILNDEALQRLKQAIHDPDR
jgi:23S rRNA pseudouridine2605 synthase